MIEREKVREMKIAKVLIVSAIIALAGCVAYPVTDPYGNVVGYNVQPVVPPIVISPPVIAPGWGYYGGGYRGGYYGGRGYYRHW